MASGQPYVQLHELDTAIQTALSQIISGGVGASGTVYTSNGVTASWQPAAGGVLYLGNNTNPSSLSDVTVASLVTGQVLTWNGSVWTNTTASGGSVLSVAATGSTGLTVTGSPITTSGTLVFTLGSELQALSGLATTGFVQRTGVATYSVANLTALQITTALGYTPGTGNGTVTSVAVSGSTGLTITGSPVTTSGAISVALSTELQGLSALSTTGLVARTGVGTYSPVTITGNSDITVTNGNGVGGNPTLVLSNTAVVPGTYNQVTVNAQGRVTAGGNQSYITGNQTITLSGDATGSGTTAIAVTLATVNSNVGTFNNVTVNGKGLVTAASNVAYLTTAVGSVTAGTGISVTGTLTAPVVNLATPVSIANGGTGQTTANAALNALLPSQTSQGGNFLTTDGTNTSWQALAFGTVTSVSTSSSVGLTLTVASPTTTPTISLAGGTLTIGHGGTGLTATPTNGQLLIGNGAGYTLSTLTPGTGITVTNNSGAVVLTNTGVTSFNSRAGAVTLTSSDVTTALGYTPANGGSITIVKGDQISLVAGPNTYTFPTAFPTACLSVVITPGPGSNASFFLTAISRFSFSLDVGVTQTYSYVAVGY